MKVLSLLVLLPALLVTLLGGILIQSGGTPNTESGRFVMQNSEDVSRYEVIQLPPQTSADKPSDAQNKDNKAQESTGNNTDTNNNKPQDNGVDISSSNNEQSTAEKITYSTCDWPHYDTIQSLYKAATDIYEGKVSDVFFKIIDMRSGKVIDDKTPDDKAYLSLYTVYEIDVTDSYKNAESNKMYVCVCTGLEGHKEAEQRDLMESAGIYNENTGIQVLREFKPLQIGNSYLFLTVDLGGTYNYIVNADQFAFNKNDAENSETFGYSEIKTFVAPPVPSIQAESISEIVSLLVNSDVTGYREELRPKYQELFSQLKKSGFIYQVVTSDNEAAEDAVTLFEREGKNLFFVMPYDKYEDVGIVTNVMFRGTLYQIWLYSADARFLSNDVNISEYIKTRLYRKVTEEKNNVCFMTEGRNGKDYLKNCAASFIDSNYYYIAKTEASQDELKTFLDVLSFEKVSIE